MTTKKAIVVLSGGQDSTTCLALAMTTYGAANVHAITFNYGQRHIREIEAAHRIAQLAGISDRHEVIHLGDDILKGTSPLTDKSQELEQYGSYEQMDAVIGGRIEKTFVPMRNALFLTIAANRAAVMGCERIVTGVCQQDNANYPDCRRDFIDAQAWAINRALGTTRKNEIGDEVFDTDRGAIFIEAPLMYMSKAQSIHRLFDDCGVNRFAWLAFSHTAYDGQYPPLYRDHATVLREQGFAEAGIPDPLMVRAWMDGLISYPAGANYCGPWAQAHGQELIDAIKTMQTALGLVGTL